MDGGASFQFLVDALRARLVRDRAGSARIRPERMAAAGLLVPRLRRRPRGAASTCSQPARRVDLVGHSLGGNIVMQYAGVRPQRVRAVVSLEGFGIPAETPDRGAEAIREVARRGQGAARVQAVREPRRRRRPAAEDQSAPAARQRAVPRRPLGRDPARRQRAPAGGPAAQAAVSLGVSDGRGLCDLAPDHRASAVGGRRALGHSRSGSPNIRKARSAPTASPASGGGSRTCRTAAW